ncbi:MAG TPA: SAF domain-containing protein [Anaerolineales bacterium]|nr:SAF domain-containing protein [Anaerolineales bacterium]
MLKRIANTGVNLVVLGVSVAIFLAAFFALSALGAAGRPPTLEVLSATRDLNIGDVISANDLIVKKVFQDDNAALYILGEEAAGVVGGIVAQPIFSGQPIFRTAIIAQAAEGTRLSAVLAKYPGYSLFPLPLDAMNLVAPDVEAFLPGDLVGVTVVISSRPQQLTTPTPMPELILGPGYNTQPTTTPAPVESAQADALSRALPPLAKDLFPMGVRVIAVQGLPPSTSETSDSSGSAFSTSSQPRMLILLIPNAAREVLSLALQQGDRLVVSLMARGDETPTAGFTYWDFEDLFKHDREEVLGGGQ